MRRIRKIGVCVRSLFRWAWDSVWLCRLLLFAILLLAALAWGYEYALRARLSHARQGCGTFQAGEDYYRVIRAAGRDMLLKPPVMIPPESPRLSRFALLDRIKRLGQRNPLVFSFPQAVLAWGLAEAYEWRRDPADLEALEKYFNKHVHADGSFVQPLSQVDQTMNGYALIILAQATQDSRFRRALDTMTAWLLERSRKNPEGLVYYREQDEHFLVDTLGMICPFLARYGRTYGYAPATELAVRQLTNYIGHAVIEPSGLPYHGYAPRRQDLPAGSMDWSRGIGWYVLGLAATARELDRGDPAYALAQVSLRKTAATLLRNPARGGGWAAHLSASGPTESSATAMIAYALTDAARRGLLEPTTGGDLQPAMDALIQNTRADGTVDFASGDCGGFNRYSWTYGPSECAQGMTIALMTTWIRPAAADR